MRFEELRQALEKAEEAVKRAEEALEDAEDADERIRYMERFVKKCDAGSLRITNSQGNALETIESEKNELVALMSEWRRRAEALAFDLLQDAKGALQDTGGKGKDHENRRETRRQEIATNLPYIESGRNG